MTAPGTVFGQFQLLELLGRGATGSVHLARPLHPGGGVPPLVVVKRLHTGLDRDEQFLRRFRHEAELAQRIDSPHVAKLIDVGRVDSSFYLVMEFIRGWPLSRVLRALQAEERLLKVEWALAVARAMLAGLEAIHAARDAGGRPLGIVHRDVTPKNVMVRHEGTACLIDLGLGKSRLQDWKTATGVVMGTLGYMAPEQVLGQEMDPRGDVFAAAVVIWEMLTGRFYLERRPMAEMLRDSAAPRFTPPSRLRPDLPASVDEVLERALALRPEERFPDARSFSLALCPLVPAQDSRPLRAALGDELYEEAEAEETRLATRLAELTPAVPLHSRPAEGAARIPLLSPGLSLPDARDLEAGTPASITPVLLPQREARPEPASQSSSAAARAARAPAPPAEPRPSTPSKARPETSAPAAARPRRGEPTATRAATPSGRWLVPMLVAALPLALVLGMLVERRRQAQEPAPVVQATVSPQPPPGPAASGLPPSEPQVVPQAPAVPSAQARVEREEPRAPSRETKAREVRPPAPRDVRPREEETQAAQPAPQSAEVLARTLTERAWRLLARTPEAAQGEVKAVLDELVRAGASPRLEDERARLIELEQRLLSLERRAR